MKFLAFVNWSALGIGALMALLYAVVCLMMWPYPELVEHAGGGFDHAVRVTWVLTGFTAIAGLSTWLLQTRHALLWLGQALLLMAVIGLLVFAWMQR